MKNKRLRRQATNLAVVFDTALSRLNIKIPGYGDRNSIDGFGVPIMLDRDEHGVHLLVWADINQEDPTHHILLEGAREDRRKTNG